MVRTASMHSDTKDKDSTSVHTYSRGGSRISEKGGLLINIHEEGEGSGAEPQPPTLFYYIMRTTLHNVMILPCRLFARRAAVACITNFSHLYFAIILNDNYSLRV